MLHILRSGIFKELILKHAPQSIKTVLNYREYQQNRLNLFLN